MNTNNIDEIKHVVTKPKLRDDISEDLLASEDEKEEEESFKPKSEIEMKMFIPNLEFKLLECMKCIQPPPKKIQPLLSMIQKRTVPKRRYNLNYYYYFI